MYISIYRSLVMARFKILRAQNLAYNLHKTKVEVFFIFIFYINILFLYNKIREERVDTIKKIIPYISNSSWFRVFCFRRLVK